MEAGEDGPAAFADRARQVTAQWGRSAAARRWSDGLVVMERTAMAVLPSYAPIPAEGRNTPGVSGLAAVSADGRTLTLTFLGGARDTAWGGYRHESPATVVAGSWVRRSPGVMPAVGVFRTARVSLARPLGTRVVLDVASGRPLVRNDHGSLSTRGG